MPEATSEDRDATVSPAEEAGIVSWSRRGLPWGNSGTWAMCVQRDDEGRTMLLPLDGRRERILGIRCDFRVDLLESK